jgi:hypothetical protein
MKLDELSLLFEEQGIDFVQFLHVAEAYKNAKLNAGTNDMIYIGGSTFVVADFLDWKKNNISF